MNGKTMIKYVKNNYNGNIKIKIFLIKCLRRQSFDVNFIPYDFTNTNSTKR